MPEEIISGYEIAQGRAESFYTHFERKGELQHQTHYCPGCGHGNHPQDAGPRHRRARHPGPDCFDKPRLGCSVFAYTDHVATTSAISQRAHGRAPAVATAAKRTRPHSIVVATRAMATCPPSARRRFCTRPIAARTSPSSLCNNAIYR